MPMPDPLENIMRILREKGSTDPNSSASRSAAMKEHRTIVGASPQATRQPPVQQGSPLPNMPRDVMPDVPGIPTGPAPETSEQPNMMGTIIDALNEAIIGLKTEIHRAPDPEQKKMLEAEAQAIRDRIVELGGEPVWADESIEEGLQKLRGLGAVSAAPTWSNLNLGSSSSFGEVPDWVKQEEVQNVGEKSPFYEEVLGLNQQPPAGNEWWDLFGSSGGGSQGAMMPAVSAPSISAPTVAVPEMPKEPTATPGYYTSLLKDAESQGLTEIEELIENITGQPVSEQPTPVVDTDYVNQMIQQYGIQPKTPEEISEHAKALVERQKLSQEQLINREIERFERNYPNEFERAQQQVQESAAELSADKREEMASRGMFYSSIMANAVENIDEATVETIGEISRDAANYVSELRADLKDLGQWAVVEEEIVKRELEAEDQEHRKMLMSMHVEVASWSDQMALDSWYKREALEQQQDQVNLQAIQLKMQAAEQQGQHLAYAFMADHPLVQNTLKSMGYSPEAFAAMPLESQSYLVQSVVGFNEVQQEMQAKDLQMRATIAQIALENSKIQLQASIASGQLAMDAQGLNLQYAMHKDTMALNWAKFGLDERLAEWQMSQPTGGYGSAAAESSISPDLMMVGLGAAAAGDSGVYNYVRSLAGPTESRILQSEWSKYQQSKSAGFASPAGEYRGTIAPSSYTPSYSQTAPIAGRIRGLYR
jgi:hypothetical protein